MKLNQVLLIYTLKVMMFQMDFRGNAARLIQSYEKIKNKRVRRIQHLITKKNGDESIVCVDMDTNQNYGLKSL